MVVPLFRAAISVSVLILNLLTAVLVNRLVFRVRLRLRLRLWQRLSLARFIFLVLAFRLVGIGEAVVVNKWVFARVIPIS